MDIEMFEAMFELRKPLIREAIRHLSLAPGSRGLDVGCNIGLITTLLAESVSPDGCVTGVDISAQYLEYARSGAGGADRLTFVQGDVNALPFTNDSFDWIWSMDTIWAGPPEFGCPAQDPQPLVRELSRVVAPGGRVALLYWSGQKLLPGYPHLEARLSATSQALAPYTAGSSPANHFMRALRWLREAGLEDLKAASFVADIVAPVSGTIRRAMSATFPMFWSQAKDEVTAEDWDEYLRLCNPGSPDFIVDEPDYFAFITYTLFQGTVT